MKIARAAVVAMALVPAFAVGLAAEGRALACGGAMSLEDITPQKPTAVQEIARAEKALEAGQSLTAVAAVLSTFPGIRSLEAGSSPLESRALRVFAMTLVRSDGAIDEQRAHVASANGLDWSPTSNVGWAVQALREIDATRPNDPTVQADLGEALSKTAPGQPEALKLLQNLAQKDLMGSPHAYAALAKLRTQTGDAAGAEAAVRRCEEMSRAPGVCKPAPAAKSAPKRWFAAKV